MHHLKAPGTSNWPKLRAAIEEIEQARADDRDVTSNMYTYAAGGTGLVAGMPPWVQEGGRRRRKVSEITIPLSRTGGSEERRSQLVSY